MSNDNTQRSYGYSASESSVHYIQSQIGTSAYNHQSGSNKRRRKNTLPDQISHEYISRGSDQIYGSTQIRDMQTSGYPNSNYQHNPISTQINVSQPLTFEAAVNNQQTMLNNTRSLSIDSSNHSIYGQNTKPLPSSSKMSSVSNISSQSQALHNIGEINDPWCFPVQNNAGHTNQMLSNGQFATQDLNAVNQDSQIFQRQQMAMISSTQGQAQQRPIHTEQSQSTDHNSVAQQNLWLLSPPFYFAQPIESAINNNSLQPELSPTFNPINTDHRMSISQSQQFSQISQSSFMEMADGLRKKLDRSFNSLSELNDSNSLQRICDDIASYINQKKYTQEIFHMPEIQQKLYSCLKMIRQYCRDDVIKPAIDVFQTVVDNLHLFSEVQVRVQLQQWLKQLNQIYFASQRSISRGDKQPIAASDSTTSTIVSHGTTRFGNCQIQTTRPMQYRAGQQQPSLSMAHTLPSLRRSTNSSVERVDRSKWASRLIDHAWNCGIPPYDVQSLVQHPHPSSIQITSGSIYISQEIFNRIWRSEMPKLSINSTPSQLPLTYRLISRRTKNIDIDPKSDKCDWPPEEACFSVYINNNVVKLERKQRILHNGVEQYQGVDRPVDVSRYIDIGWNTITINQCGCVWCIRNSNEREISIQVFAWENQEFVLRLARLQRLTYEHGLSIAKVKQSRSGESNNSHDIIPTRPTMVHENQFSNPDHTITTIDDDDDDVTAYKMTVSLKCPLGMVRIKEPAKGLYCVHIGCFDLETYVQVNMVHTKWTCPVCNGVVTSETLRVDDYFITLLEQFSSNVSKIAVDSNGTWTIVEQDDNDAESSDDESSNIKRREEPSVTLIVLDDDDDDQPAQSELPKQQNEQQMTQPIVETVNTDIVSSPIPDIQTRNQPTLESLISSSNVQTRSLPALESLASVAASQMHLPQQPEASSHVVLQIQTHSITASQVQSPLSDSLSSPDTINDATSNDELKAHYNIQETNLSTSTPPNDKDPPSDTYEGLEEYSEEEIEEVLCDWTKTINPLF